MRMTPKRSPRAPKGRIVKLNASAYALIVHAASAALTWRTCVRRGSATFTTPVSSVEMKNESAAVATARAFGKAHRRYYTA